jgi:hypothetical protein
MKAVFFSDDLIFQVGSVLTLINIFLICGVLATVFVLRNSVKRKKVQKDIYQKRYLPIVTEIIFLENYHRIAELKLAIERSDQCAEAVASILVTLSVNFNGEETDKLRFLFKESGLEEDRISKFIRTGDMRCLKQLLQFRVADDFESMVRLLGSCKGESKRELLLHILGKGDIKLFWAINDQIGTLTEWDQLLVIERLYKKTRFNLFDEQFPLHLKDDGCKLFVLRLIRRFNLVQHHSLLLFFLSDSVKIESEVISIAEQFPSEANVFMLKSMFPCKDPMNNIRIRRLLRSYGEGNDIRELDGKLSEWQTIQFNFAPPFLN